MKDQNQQSINLLIYRLVTKDLLTPFLITEAIIGGNQWEILLNFKKHKAQQVSAIYLKWL